MKLKRFVLSTVNELVDLYIFSGKRKKSKKKEKKERKKEKRRNKKKTVERDI